MVLGLSSNIKAEQLCFLRKTHFKTDKDVRNCMQPRVSALPKLGLFRCTRTYIGKAGHGCTFLDEDGGGSIQQRVSQEKNSNQYGLPLELFLTIDKVLLTILPYCCGVLIKHTRKKPPALLQGGGSLSDL